jgi:hypothetical protein
VAARPERPAVPVAQRALAEALVRAVPAARPDRRRS